MQTRKGRASSQNQHIDYRTTLERCTTTNKHAGSNKKKTFFHFLILLSFSLTLSLAHNKKRNLETKNDSRANKPKNTTRKPAPTCNCFRIRKARISNTIYRIPSAVHLFFLCALVYNRTTFTSFLLCRVNFGLFLRGSSDANARPV